MSNHRLVTAVVAGFLAGVAQCANAADLELAYKAPTNTWTGCYGGVHVGLGGMQDSWSSDDGPTLWGYGFIGGGQLGCNYELGRFVVGIESEVWGSSLRSERNFTTQNTAIKTSTSNPWNFATSFRAGIAIDTFLIYLKGGIVWGAFNYNVTSFNDAARSSAINTGVLLGLGLEHAVTPLWTMKAEGNVLLYTASNAHFQDDFGGIQLTQSATQFLIKVGANRRFGSDFSIALD